MVRVARGLRDLGHDVEMVVCSDTGPFGAELGAEVPVVNLKSLHMRRSIGPIVHYLRARRPRTVLVTLDHMILTVLIARAISRVPVRVVAREANHFSARKPQGIKARLLSKAFLAALRRADDVIAVSEGVSTDLRIYGKVARDKLHTIYNPVVDEELERKAKLDVSHPFLGDGVSPVILAAGRLIEQKDFPTLLRALRELRETQAARLIILGEGPERQKLEKLVGELGLAGAVSLPGFVENPFGFMRRASAFVLSSAWEGLPGVLVQAMACGCPVVSTDCRSGPDEILDNGRFGELVPVGDSSALAAAIVRTLKAPPDSEVLRARANEFSVERSLARYEELLRL